MKWFKFYGTEYLADPKMLALTAEERSCWLTLLCYVSVNDNEIDNGKIKHLSEQQLMVQSGLDFQDENWDRTIGVLEKLKSLEMIEIDNGVITVKNWDKRQESALTGYERVKRYRDKAKVDNEGDNALITSEEKRVEENRIEKNIHIRFTSFWNEYPKKAGKVIAERAFNRLNPSKTLFDKVLEDVRQRKQSEQWQKEKGKFILNPATYLNQRRWEDETKLPPKEKKPYYQGKEMQKDERGKWWVLHEGKRLEFAGKEEDIQYL